LTRWESDNSASLNLVLARPGRDKKNKYTQWSNVSQWVLVAVSKKKNKKKKIYTCWLSWLVADKRQKKKKQKQWMVNAIPMWCHATVHKRKIIIISKSIASSSTAVFRKEKKGNRRRTMQVISVQEVERKWEKQLHSYYY
jgi:hypothetical protein